MYAVNDGLYCGCTPVVHVYSYSDTHSDFKYKCCAYSFIVFVGLVYSYCRRREPVMSCSKLNYASVN